jgi:hypothetical protein
LQSTRDIKGEARMEYLLFLELQATSKVIGGRSQAELVAVTSREQGSSMAQAEYLTRLLSWGNTGSIANTDFEKGEAGCASPARDVKRLRREGGVGQVANRLVLRPRAVIACQSRSWLGNAIVTSVVHKAGASS